MLSLTFKVHSCPRGRGRQGTALRAASHSTSVLWTNCSCQPLNPSACIRQGGCDLLPGDIIIKLSFLKVTISYCTFSAPFQVLVLKTWEKHRQFQLKHNCFGGSCSTRTAGISGRIFSRFTWGSGVVLLPLGLSVLCLSQMSLNRRGKMGISFHSHAQFCPISWVLGSARHSRAVS